MRPVTPAFWEIAISQLKYAERTPAFGLNSESIPPLRDGGGCVTEKALEESEGLESIPPLKDGGGCVTFRTL